VKLRYTLRGAAELDQVLDYIETQSPQGAHHVQARIKVIIECYCSIHAPGGSPVKLGCDESSSLLIRF
jgi:toxin ParE1/3/4